MMYIHISTKSSNGRPNENRNTHSHTQQRFHEVSTMNEGKQGDEAHIHDILHTPHPNIFRYYSTDDIQKKK